VNIYGRDITKRKLAEAEISPCQQRTVFQNEEKEKRAVELVLANNRTCLSKRREGKSGQQS